MGIELIKGDITQLHVDAIVNAANPGLLGGGGVDGAIHRAAGHLLKQACMALDDISSSISPSIRCPTGEARWTKGFKLPAHYVIHTVGPVWRGGQQNEAHLLSRCYNNCLHLANQLPIESIAFPAISCGIYGYPLPKAADIALKVLSTAIHKAPRLQQIIICCFNEAVYMEYDRQISQP